MLPAPDFYSRRGVSTAFPARFGPRCTAADAPILPSSATASSPFTGSTARTSLFEHDLPRPSVDIDLAWLPVHDCAEDAKLIAEALGRLADVLRARPLQLQAQASAGEGGAVTRLVASRDRARVQIETTPVMRGTVHTVRTMVVRPRVEETFGFVESRCWLSSTCMPASWRRRCRGSIRAICSTWACC